MYFVFDILLFYDNLMWYFWPVLLFLFFFWLPNAFAHKFPVSLCSTAFRSSVAVHCSIQYHTLKHTVRVVVNGMRMYWPYTLICVINKLRFCASIKWKPVGWISNAGLANRDECDGITLMRKEHRAFILMAYFRWWNGCLCPRTQSHNVIPNAARQQESKMCIMELRPCIVVSDPLDMSVCELFRKIIVDHKLYSSLPRHTSIHFENRWKFINTHTHI